MPKISMTSPSVINAPPKTKSSFVQWLTNLNNYKKKLDFSVCKQISSYIRAQKIIVQSMICLIENVFQCVLNTKFQVLCLQTQSKRE